MSQDQKAETSAMRAVYDRYVKPVEHEHIGEYALVTPAGQTFFAPTFIDIMILADERPDVGNAIFKVERVMLGRV